MRKFCIFLILISAISAYYHGSGHNSVKGGTCGEFLHNNHMDTCCLGRNDECYMIHFDTRCYCDQFCGKNSSGDCCPDVIRENNINKCILRSNVCQINGNTYQNGQRFMVNCNHCRCKNGAIECQKKPCLINPDLLAKINHQNYGWKAANYSFFWSKTLEFAYIHYLGAAVPSFRQRPLSSFLYDSVQSFYDFRREPYFFGKYSNGIKNQGMCPVSWAISMLDIVVDRASKYSRKSIDKKPSAEQLISCRSISKSINKCSSLSIDQGWLTITNTTGIVDTECYGNSDLESGFVFTCKMKNDTCPSSSSVSTKKFHVSKAYPVMSYDRNIMNEIYMNGPVQMVFRIFDDFFMYKSGIYSPSPAARSYIKDQYHAVKILGWGTENGVDYWLAANSWGPDWGENGYFRIRRNDHLTEIGKHVYAAWAFYK